MAALIEELKRRNIFRVGLAYAVIAWLILQVGSIVVLPLGLPEWTMAFLIFILAVGFPLVLVFAWAFELTPEGLKRSDEVDEEASVSPSTGKRLNQLTIGVLCLAVALLLVDRFFFTGAPTPAPEQERTFSEREDGSYQSIAVLPFVNMSDEKQQEYFSDGISEELLNLLAKIHELRVAARTSSFAFKGKTMDIKEIARQLDVETVLEGSVRRSGTRLRITAQLIDADTGYHLWSETYDRELTDVFAIQDEISSAIVNALKVHLVGAPAKQIVTDVKAYDAFLKGREQVRTRASDSLYTALSNFETAIQIDPDYAPAHAAKAETYALLEEYSDFPQDQAINLAQTAIKKALALDPDLADAHAVRGLLLLKTGELEQALVSLDRAIALAPDMVRAHIWRANLYSSLGNPASALKGHEKAHELDPLFDPAISNLIGAYFQIGRDDLAFELYSKHKALSANEGTDKSFPDLTWALHQGDYSGILSADSQGEEGTFSDQAAAILKHRQGIYAGPSVRSILFRDLEEMREMDTVAEFAKSDFGKINIAFQHIIQPSDGSFPVIFDLTKDLDRSFDGPLFGANPEIAIASLLLVPWRKAGEEGEAIALADQLRAYIVEMEGRGFERSLDAARAALKVFDGDHDGAMAILEEMASYHGLYWWFDWFPSFTDLHGRRDFQALFDEVYKHINAERAKLGWDPVERTVLD